jgi:hypothetical protein
MPQNNVTGVNSKRNTIVNNMVNLRPINPRIEVSCDNMDDVESIRSTEKSEDKSVITQRPARGAQYELFNHSNMNTK